MSEFGFGLFLVAFTVAICGAFYLIVKWYLDAADAKKKRDIKVRKKQRAARDKLRAAKQVLLDAKAQIKARYSKEYEERKITIGTIKCSQCEWSGQWGTGMTYEQFFAGNLFEAGVITVSEMDVNNDNLSRDNRQYTCPVCNSSGWQKA